MEIYAKSATPQTPAETLEQHTFNCLSVLRSLREAFPYLPQLCHEPHLWRHLFLAVYLHDLGKAATGFQAMLSGGAKWEYRHEILSAGFVPFLQDLTDAQRMTVALAVITHHKTVSKLAGGWNSVQDPRTWRKKRDELKPNLAFTQEWLRRLPDAAQEFIGEALPAPRIPQSVEEIEDAFRYAAFKFKDNVTPLPQIYATLLRGLVVACDHLASGGRMEILKPIADLPSHLKRDLPADFPRPFQREAGAHDGSLLLCAPTGSGKTEAALLWAANQQDSGRRIFYVLPYTASINAMQHRFEARYDLKEQVSVLHGKAPYFMYQALCEKEYEPKEAAREAKEIQNLARKIYRPIKILTPFQIIKAFFGVRGWEMQIAEMAGGIFIFDEIHVYDARTTALLLTSLERLSALDAKFLFMSATFPAFLKKEIHAIVPGLVEKAPREKHQADIELLNAPRHRVEILEGEIFDHIPAIAEALSDGCKVLVVCNTVKRAQEVFGALREAQPKSALLHGRFILRDRERIEAQLKQVKLLVGTQVVEVSLDLDFDTIFTEPAPIDALVQRFGRVNRKGEKGTVPVHIFTRGGEKDRYFYDAERIARTLEVLQPGMILTQGEVARCVDEVYQNGYNAREQKTYDEVRHHFQNLIADLLPFDASRHEEDFYDLIQSIQVVPREFEREYCAAIEAKQFFEAMKFQATVSMGQGMKLKNLEALPRREIQLDRKTKSYFRADVAYDSELGLLLDQIDLGGVFLD